MKRTKHIRPIRVCQVGIGPLGILLSQMFSAKDGFRIVHAVDIDPTRIGKSVGELTDLPQLDSLTISNGDSIEKGSADIAVLTTGSKLEVVAQQISTYLNAGMHVVSTCEELSFPWIAHQAIAKKIDKLAKEKSVSVLGTGVNPGFLMDFLPVAVSGVCERIESIKISRVQNARKRRLPFLKKIGVGMGRKEFETKIGARQMGHVGLLESMHMLLSAMKVDHKEVTIVESIDPIVSDQKILASEWKVEKGQIAGLSQKLIAKNREQNLVEMLFKASVIEDHPKDEIEFMGSPNWKIEIPGALPGDTATCAAVIHSIPTILSSEPGLHTMLDFIPFRYRTD